MNVVDLLGPLASAAAVSTAMVGWASHRDAKRHRRKEKLDSEASVAAELQRKLDRAEQTKAIQDAIDGLGTKVYDRFDKNDQISAEAAQRIQRLEDEQFGPNHGGARQAINETARDVKAIRQDLSAHTERLTRLETVVFPPAGPLAPTA